MAGLFYLNITDWRYENVGLAQLLSISGTTLNNLPLKKSRTGVAFYQTTRAKCFDLPASRDLWIKFDVYFDGSNRWRAYNQGSAGFCGVCSYVNNNGGNFGMWQNDTKVQDFRDVCKPNQLQTVLLHMVSGTNGLIEAWVDGTKIYTFNGDVNHGDDFADFYLQSDGAGTFFSNVIIANSQIGLSENIPPDGLAIKPELYASLLPSGNFPQKISVDLLRTIAKTEKITANIKRQIGVTQKNSTDLLRTVTKVEKIIGDTSRQVANGSIALTKAYAALIRKITTTEQSPVDTARLIGVKEKVSANTVRCITQRNSIAAETLLRIGTAEKLPAELLLRLRHFARANTERKIIKRQKIKTDTIIRIPHILNYYSQRRNALRKMTTRDDSSTTSIVNTFKDYGVTQVIVTLNEKTLSDTFEVTFVNSAEKTAPTIGETIRFRLLDYSFEFVVDERQIAEDTTIISGQYNKNNILYRKYNIPDFSKSKRIKGAAVFASDDSVRADSVDNNPIKFSGVADVSSPNLKNREMVGAILIEDNPEVSGSSLFYGVAEFALNSESFSGEITVNNNVNSDENFAEYYKISFSGSAEAYPEKDEETGLTLLDGAASIDGGTSDCNCVSFKAQLKESFSTYDLLVEIAKKMGLKLEANFDDFYPVTLEGVKTMTYQEILSNLFGWSSKVPTIQVNVFIREDTLYVIQRGMETNEIGLANYPATKQTSTEKKLNQDIYSDDDLIDTSDDDDDDDDVPFSGTISYSAGGGQITCHYSGGLLSREELVFPSEKGASRTSETRYTYDQIMDTTVEDTDDQEDTYDQIVTTTDGTFARTSDNSFVEISADNTNEDNENTNENNKNSTAPDISNIGELSHYYLVRKSMKARSSQVSGGILKENTQTSEIIYSYQKADKDVYLYREHDTSKQIDERTNLLFLNGLAFPAEGAQLSKTTTKTTVRDTLHIPAGNGFYVTVLLVDGKFQGGNVSTGKPGNAISPYTVKRTQENLKAMGCSNVPIALDAPENIGGISIGGATPVVETTTANKTIKLGEAFKILTHDDKDSEALYAKCLQEIISLSNAIETTISCDIVSQIREGVPDIDHIIDFLSTIDGGYLVSNKITFTPRKLIQSLTFRKWKWGENADE